MVRATKQIITCRFERHEEAFAILILHLKEYENLTVIEPSWQNILCEHVGIKGMKLSQDFLHQTLKVYVKLEEIENHIKNYNLDKYRLKRTRQLRLGSYNGKCKDQI